jgi:hypothetical protein
VAEPGDAGAVGKCDIQRLTNANPDVLDRVVGAGLKVACSSHFQIQARMERQQIEHVVQEPNARRTLSAPRTVEVDPHMDVGLSGLPLDLGAAAHRG